MAEDDADQAADAPLLPSRTWKTSYRHEESDLVEEFYVPALSCAVQYDRMTGYFSADALALAARGIERLIANHGHMRLIVGCTLEDDEVEAIQQGYELREMVNGKLAQADLTPPDPSARKGLEALAWMIAHDVLEVKVAVPVGANGEPAKATGIYHEKVGVVTDGEGNQISFSGSLNETRGGWINNRESFHVHCSWESGREYQHVADEVAAFNKLWAGKTTATKVFRFPEAAQEKLLEFLPADDRFLRPPSRQSSAGDDGSSSSETSTAGPLTADEKRRIVWTYIRNAARMPGGLRVGEVTSAVKPWPHQLRTFKQMIDEWPCRLLIADEVGLGKTISAGLLIRQAWLSGLARRILIMVPRSVVPQWQNELYEKFNLNVPFYDGQKLVWKDVHGWRGPTEKTVPRDKWHEEPFVLCSSHLMRRRDRAEELLQADDWDLVVLDEAHHARRRGAGTPQEKGPNRLLDLMQQLQSRCRSLMLLTATPMQVDPVEIWDLLKLLGLPSKWAASRETFIRYFEAASGNPSHEELAFLAGMFRNLEEEIGEISEDDIAGAVPELSPIKRRKVLKGLRDRSGIPLKRLDAKTRQATLKVLRRFTPVRYRMFRHTRELLRAYSRADMLDSPIAERKISDRPIDLSRSERDLYEAVDAYIRSTYNRASPEKRSAVGFVMTVYRRRLASSFEALKRTLLKRLDRMESPVSEEDVSQDELRDNAMDVQEATELAQTAGPDEERSEINNLLKKIARLGADTKAKQLKAELGEAFGQGYQSAIVFTQYTDTMEALKDFLADEFPERAIGCYSGSGGLWRDVGGVWNECSKEAIKDRLKEGKIDLLICTDAAGEGLNLHYCGVLVNYDLPWNPMKVEQRIGRIDRIGQQHGEIRVINFAYKDTVEADVYFALGNRINLFQGIVGKLQPILSRLPREIEHLCLEESEDQEAVRNRFLQDLYQKADEAQDTSFDIDEIAAEALEVPELPEPALTLEEIDEVLDNEQLRPPELEWKRLDFRSYSARLPGMKNALRATTSDEVFDAHFESHQFLSPGGQLFQELGKCVDEPDEGEGNASCGRFWLVSHNDSSRGCGVIAASPSGTISIKSLTELLGCLDSVGEAEEPGPEFQACEVQTLA